MLRARLAVIVGSWLVSCGCFCGAVFSWAEDEVVVSGAGSGDEHQDFSILFSVKNIVELPDGRYEVRPPAGWDQLSRTHADDGVVEVRFPAPLQLLDAEEVIGWSMWDIKVADLSLLDAEAPVCASFSRTSGDGSTPGVYPRLGASVVHDTDRLYRVVVWGEDLNTDRWLRLGEIRVGHGSQSRYRWVGEFVALPVAFAVDVVATPVILATGLLLLVTGALPAGP